MTLLFFHSSNCRFNASERINNKLLLSAKHVFVSNNTVFGERQAPLLRGNNGCPLKIPSLTRHKPNRGWLYLLF